MNTIPLQRLLSETFLKQASWLEQTSSTNTVATELARQPGALPALIGADQQLQGRGRKNHQWWAGSGALTFSILLRPKELGIHPQQWPLLSMATGLAVCRMLEVCLPQSQHHVKWPNDVYTNSRKICGILLETIADFPDLLVVGIGVNVNNSLAMAPAELPHTATSMVDVAGHPFQRHVVLINLLNQFAEELRTLSQDEGKVIRGCRERCYLTGRLLTVRDVKSQLTGMCLGIDDDGALRLMTESGPRRLFTGEIKRIE